MVTAMPVAENPIGSSGAGKLATPMVLEVLIVSTELPVMAVRIQTFGIIGMGVGAIKIVNGLRRSNTGNWSPVL